MKETGKKALVLFSGGQDSTTCLAWALSRFDEVQTVGFDYGQRHRTELDCRKRILGLIESVSPLGRENSGPITSSTCRHSVTSRLCVDAPDGNQAR